MRGFRSLWGGSFLLNSLSTTFYSALPYFPDLLTCVPLKGENGYIKKNVDERRPRTSFTAPAAVKINKNLPFGIVLFTPTKYSLKSI